jgi:hypothetical protein
MQHSTLLVMLVTNTLIFPILSQEKIMNSHKLFKGNKMFDKLFALAITGLVAASSTAVLSTLSIVSTPLTPSANAQAQAQKYKVTFRYRIDQSNDGAFDNTLEVYGNVFVGGDKVGSIGRNTPRSKEAGQDLEMGSYITTNPSIVVSASLLDRDEAGSDDRVFQLGNYNLTNLAAKAGKPAVTQSWRSGEGEGATLYMIVEKVN